VLVEAENAVTTANKRTKFEHAEPILRVSDMAATVRYYTEVLGFVNAEWGSDDFTAVSREGATIYLCYDSQGQYGTWVWVGVDDVDALYQEYIQSGARVRHPPRNYPWALEIHVEDPDGHILRFGSEPIADRPFVDWIP
jgi:catechol 2,3-dioxygenase-like lactoylglutathione lyase family enzyme